MIKDILQFPIINKYIKEFEAKAQTIDQNKREQIDRLKQKYLRKSDSKISNSVKDKINIDINNNEIIPHSSQENRNIIVNENSIPSTKSSNSPRKIIDLNPPNMMIIQPKYNETFSIISVQKVSENLQEAKKIIRSSSPTRINLNSRLDRIKTENYEDFHYNECFLNVIKSCLNFAGFIIPN